MSPMEIENFGDEGLEGTLDKTKREVLDKLDEYNKNFRSFIKPENGVFGVTETLKPDGVLEKISKDSNGLYSKEYYLGDKLFKTRQQFGDSSWKTIYYDDKGIGYREKIYKKGENGSLYKSSEQLLPNIVITKENFISITDSYGRVISSEVNDLTINETGRGVLSLDTNGRGYLDNDHRGHLVPDIFNGKGSLENIVPQLNSVNQGKIKQVENIARELKEQGHVVDYKMKVNYGDVNNPMRPTSFEPKISVDGNEFKLESEFSKIYNSSDLTNLDKVKTTMNEKVNSIKMGLIDANGLGKEVALIAGGLTFVSSTSEDLKLVITGDMQVDDMVLDVLHDTTLAGGLGYMEGFVEGAICTTMRTSGNTMLTNLAKTGIPGMVIDFGIKSYDSFANYAEGKIDEFELMYDLGENATTTVVAFETAKIGATLGSGLGPLGTVGGGLVGGMVGYCISSELYVAAIDAGIEGAQLLGEKANELGNLCIELADEYIPDFAKDISSSISNFAADFNIPFNL